MFVQVIFGQVNSPGELRAALDRWAHELAAQADGSVRLLGSRTTASSSPLSGSTPRRRRGATATARNRELWLHSPR